MGFGERMQREREMRGITLEEIAQATKIGSRSLRALEQEQFEKLPGGIFNKGFVRSYARYLGIDEEQAVADYLVACGEPEEKERKEAERLKALESSWNTGTSASTAAAGSSLDLRGLWRAAAALVLLALAAFLVWHFRHSGVALYREWHARRHPAQELRAVPQISPAVVQPQQNQGFAPELSAAALPQASPFSPEPEIIPEQSAAGSAAEKSPTTNGSSVSKGKSLPEGTNQSNGNQPVDQSGPEFVVLVRARESSWVNITADGKPVMKGTLDATRETTVRARQKVTVIAGNAGGIELSFNGKPQPALGNPQQVRTVTFTAEGMQE